MGEGERRDASRLKTCYYYDIDDDDTPHPPRVVRRSLFQVNHAPKSPLVDVDGGVRNVKTKRCFVNHLQEASFELYSVILAPIPRGWRARTSLGLTPSQSCRPLCWLDSYCCTVHCAIEHTVHHCVMRVHGVLPRRTHTSFLTQRRPNHQEVCFQLATSLAPRPSSKRQFGTGGDAIDLKVTTFLFFMCNCAGAGSPAALFCRGKLP